MNWLKEWFRTAVKNPRTTATGIGAIAGGIALLKKGDWVEGVTAALVGAGLVAAPDATSSTSQEIKK
jgi:uncharacterized membrane protein YjjP (DUF1212 family)